MHQRARCDLGAIHGRWRTARSIVVAQKMRLSRVASQAAAAVLRRGFAGPSRPAAAFIGRRGVSSKVVVEPTELDIVFPRESPADGFSYDLNWSLCQHGVIPHGKAFRNLKAPALKQLGGTAAVDAPKSIPWDAALERELKAHLGTAKTTCYVQDCALGAIAANEVAARIVSDSPAAALAFRTLCSTTKGVPVSDQKCEVVVLHASKLGSHPAFITMNPKTKTILMGGSINAGALVGMLEAAATDSFLGNGVLPLWGPGDAANETVFLSAGFDAGASKVKHGFAYSHAGFCRLFMGSAAADGKVTDEYKLLPNHLPAPKTVVMFANDASATIPPAAKLTPEQAAFYFVAACAPKGTSDFGNAAALVQEMAKSVAFYIVNKGAFEDPKEADAAAKAVAGSKGSVSGPLGLEVVSVSGKTKTASPDAALAASKAFVASVSTKCKGNDAVLAAGPKIEEAAKK